MATSLYKAQSVIPTCEEHHPRELLYFCKSCKKIICTTCVKTDHTHHDWDLSSSFAKQLRKETPEKCQDIRRQLPAFKLKLSAIKQRKSTNEEKRHTFLTKLDDTRLALIDEVNKIAGKMRQIYNDLFKEECKSLEKKETKATELLEYMETMTYSLDTNIRAYSDCDVIEMEQGMSKMFEKLKTCDMDVDFDVNSALHSCGIFKPHTEALEKMVGELKNITLMNEIKRTGCDNKTAICRIKKTPDFQGYGFNILNLSKSTKPGQYISKIKEGSPVESAGLTLWSRIVEINDVNVEEETHDDVLQRIITGGKEIKLLIEGD